MATQYAYVSSSHLPGVIVARSAPCLPDAHFAPMRGLQVRSLGRRQTADQGCMKFTVSDGSVEGQIAAVRSGRAEFLAPAERKF
jgi:hypothetical protein